MSLRGHARRWDRFATALGHQLRTWVAKLKSWWAEHRQRISYEEGYTDALEDVLIALADLVWRSFRAGYCVRGLLKVYVALHRLMRPPTPEM